MRAPTLVLTLLGLAAFAVPVGSEPPSSPAAPLESAAPSGPAPVRLTFRLTDPQGEPTKVTGRLVARFPGQDLAPREVPLVASSSAFLEVPAGSSFDLELEAPGFWTFATGFNLSPEERERTVPMRVWRTGIVSGTVRGLKPSPEDPRPLAVQVLPPVGAPFTGEKPAGRVPCSLEATGAFRCELPAETFDVAFRALARVPAYRFALRVPAGGEVKVGTLELPLGSSIAGFLVSRGVPLDPKTCRVRATRAVGADLRGVESRLVELGEGTRPTDKGFFQVVGLTPGRYNLTVEQPGLGPAILGPLEVPPADELLLRDPITLWPPVVWQVSVRPALDGKGRPWILELVESRPRVAGRTPRNPERFPFDETGFLRLDRLEPGPYRLSVEDADGNRFLGDFEPRELAPEPAVQEIDIDLQLVEIEGRLLRGDDPLAGIVWFGGRFGVPNARFETDEEGGFRGFLAGEPRHWTTEITTQDGRPLSGPTVAVEPNDEGRADVEIRLPDTRLSGTVVDETGRPLEGARLLVATVGGVAPPREPRSGAKGRFVIEGLAPGTVLLSARTDRDREERRSEVVTVELREEEEPAPVKLVARPVATVRGRVLLDGAPVPVAQVLAWSLAEAPVQMADVRTDLDGNFSLPLPAGTRRAAVRLAAPLIPYQGLHLDTEAQPWTLALSSSAGELALRWPKDDRGELQGGRLIAYWNGVDLGPDTIFVHRQAQGLPLFSRPGEAELLVPRVAPGNWSVCIVARDELLSYRIGVPGPWLSRCASGSLGVGQTLRLDLKAP